MKREMDKGLARVEERRREAEEQRLMSLMDQEGLAEKRARQARLKLEEREREMLENRLMAHEEDVTNMERKVRMSESEKEKWGVS